jgi:hypothetical protein
VFISVFGCAIRLRDLLRAADLAKLRKIRRSPGAFCAIKKRIFIPCRTHAVKDDRRQLELSEKVIVAGHKECAGVGRTFSLIGGCLADSAAGFAAGFATGRANGGLELEIQSDGGLCEVGNFVDIEPAGIEVGRLIDVAAIFRANTNMFCKIPVHAATIKKRPSCLAVDAVDAAFICRIEDKSTAAGQRVWTRMTDRQREVKYESSRHLMQVGPDAFRSRRSEVVL